MTTLLTLLLAGQAPEIDYPIVYLRAPIAERVFPEVSPTFQTPHSKLMLRQPDGTETVLVDPGPHGAVLDPMPSYDGTKLYYAQCDDIGDTVRGFPRAGCSIFRLDVATGISAQLTFPGDWSRNKPQNPRNPTFDFGVVDFGPCPLPDGRVVFSSIRAGYMANGFDRLANPQLWVMDADGKNVERIGALSLAGALHPHVLVDGRIMFASAENQGRRDGKLWGLWAVRPDGTHFEPLFSAFADARSIHWQGQKSDGRIVTAVYYHQNNNGFGGLREFDTVFPVGQQFGNPNAGLNSKVKDGIRGNVSKWRFGESSYPFQPHGMTTPTPWTHTHEGSQVNPFQAEHPTLAGVMGTVSHPSGTPQNGMLLTWAKGDNALPDYDLGVYWIPDGGTEWPWKMANVVDEPDWHEYQAKALVPYSAIYGVDKPAIIPHEPSSHPLLPAGTPFGLVGTSSVYARESAPANGTGNWFKLQGTDSKWPWTNADIHAIRVIAMEPTSTDENNNAKRDFSATGNERFRILGDVPLRKPGNPLDSDGNPDTSFLARIPGDTPFTFQLLDANGMALTTAQTWRQVRPGETRTDCRGCHAHHVPGPVFAGTVASQPDYVVPDAFGNETVEWYADVRPILEQHCFQCHGPDVAEPEADFRITDKLNQSDYVEPYDSRNSLLGRKVFGIGTTQMPPAGGMTDAERRTIAKWIDLGLCTDTPGKPNGGHADDARPTLTLDSPKRVNAEPVQVIRYGAFDYESGLDASQTIVTANWEIAGRTAGTNLADLFAVSEHVWTLNTSVPETGRLFVQVRDAAGNTSRISRDFTAGTPIPDPDPDPTPDDNKAKLLEAERLIREVRGTLP